MTKASDSSSRVTEEEEIIKAASQSLQVQPFWTHTPSNDLTQADAATEVVQLLHLLVDEYLPWRVKVEAARLIALARAHEASIGVATEATEEASYAMLYQTLLRRGCDALRNVLAPPVPDPTGVRTRHASPAYGAIWNAALCGMIPALIHSLEAERLKHTTSTPAAVSQGIVSQATTAFLQQATPLLIDIETLMTREDQTKLAQAERRGEDDMAIDEWFESNSSPQAASLRCSLVRALVDLQLVSPDVCKDTPVAEALQDMEMSLTAEAGGREQLGSYLAQRLQGEEIEELLVKIASDYGAHRAFAQQVQDSFVTAVEAGDLEALSRLCRALLDNSAMVDILLLYVTPAELIRPFAELLDKPDLGEIADRSAVLGSTLLFAQWLMQRAELAGPGTCNELAHHADFLPRFMRSTPSSVCPLGDLDAAERDLVDRWIQALYDSEGISDDLMRASSPQALLRLAPLLFSQSIQACLSGVIDLETLKGGLAYFAQELLSFALPGALLWVIADVARVPVRTLPPAPGPAAPVIATSRSVHLDVLATLLTSDGCPTAVKEIIAPQLYAALEDHNASIVIASLEVSQADVTTALINANKGLPEPGRAFAWLAPLITSSLPPQTLLPDGLERHMHLLDALARGEPVSELVARHYLELLCSNTATVLPEARAALQRSLACVLAFDALRSSVQRPRIALREWSAVHVAAWLGKLRTCADVRNTTAFWHSVTHALQALQLCVSSPPHAAVLHAESVQQLWTFVAHLMALATVQTAAAHTQGLASVAPMLVSAATSGAPSEFLDPLKVVFPALSSV